MRNGFFATLIILGAIGGSALSDEPRSSAVAPARGTLSFDDDQMPPLAEDGVAPDGRGSGRIWGSAEFLLWWLRDGNAPALATSGVPGAPGTTIFGGGLGYNERPGARFTLGTWLNCDQTKGIEASYFFLNGGAAGFGANSTGAAGSAFLARPFFNVNSGLPDFQIIAAPGVAAGNIQTSSDSQLQGAGLNLFCNLCCRPACCPTDACDTGCSRNFGYRFDVYAGPRWLQLDEDLVISERVTNPMGTFNVVDRFETRNNFYGGQIGARAELQRGRCFVNVRGGVALGATHQEVRISGTTVITEPGAAPNVQQGGLLALPTNIGTYSRDVFSVVPEIGLNVGCQVTRRLRAFAGYSFFYWSNVVRPGDQIDLGVNPTQIPSADGPGTLVGPARPAFAFRDTDFWAHGINVGLEFRW